MARWVWRASMLIRLDANLLYAVRGEFTAECGSSCDAGIGSVVGRHQWDFLAMRIHRPTGKLIVDVSKERLQHGGYAPAYDHHIGLKQVHDRSQPHGEKHRGFLQKLFG